jgi:hypothetical protein
MKIALCIPGNTFSREVMMDTIRFLDDARMAQWEVVLSMDYDPNVYYVRNKLLGGDVGRGPQQKPFNGEFDYDYVVWIDSDIRFNFKMVERLASHKKDAICGLYRMKDMKNFTVVRHMDDEYFKAHKTYQFLTVEDVEKIRKTQKVDLMKIDYTGMGLFLVSRQALEKLEYPWFQPVWKEIGNMRDFTSEDVAFCIKLRETGTEIYCDPEVMAGHMKLVPI